MLIAGPAPPLSLTPQNTFATTPAAPSPELRDSLGSACMNSSSEDVTARDRTRSLFSSSSASTTDSPHKRPSAFKADGRSGGEEAAAVPVSCSSCERDFSLVFRRRQYCRRCREAFCDGCIVTADVDEGCGSKLKVCEPCHERVKADAGHPVYKLLGHLAPLYFDAIVDERCASITALSRMSTADALKMLDRCGIVENRHRMFILAKLSKLGNARHHHQPSVAGSGGSGSSSNSGGGVTSAALGELQSPVALATKAAAASAAGVSASASAAAAAGASSASTAPMRRHFRTQSMNSSSGDLLGSLGRGTDTGPRAPPFGSMSGRRMSASKAGVSDPTGKYVSTPTPTLQERCQDRMYSLCLKLEENKTRAAQWRSRLLECLSRLNTERVLRRYYGILNRFKLTSRLLRSFLTVDSSSSDVHVRKDLFLNGAHHAPSCNVCGVSYTFFNREHHCRTCYESCCGVCCSRPSGGAPRLCLTCARGSGALLSPDVRSRSSSLRVASSRGYI